jgi:hypothetical protein
VLLVASALAVSVAVQTRALSQLPLEVLQVAADARPRLVAGERVYARKPHFAWAAHLTATAFPFAASLSELADDARRDGVRWLYFSWPEAEMRPQFLYLLDTTSAVPGLTVRAVSRGHPAVLYEIGPGFGRDPEWLADGWQAEAHRARAALQIDTRDWKSRIIAAADAQRRGRWEEAQPWLEEAAALSDGDAQLMLADNDVHLGRLTEARMLYDTARRRLPADPRPLVGLGWVALLSNDTAQAAEFWRPVVSATGDQATLVRMVEVFDSVHDEADASAAREALRRMGARP